MLISMTLGVGLDVLGPDAAAAADLVAFDPSVAIGTIVVSTGERRLYFVLTHGKALRYSLRGRKMAESLNCLLNHSISSAYHSRRSRVHMLTPDLLSTMPPRVLLYGVSRRDPSTIEPEFLDGRKSLQQVGP
jgi:hypothetical protein